MPSEKTDSLIDGVQSKKAKFGASSRAARESVITNLDDLTIQRNHGDRSRESDNSAKTKLEIAHDVGEQLQREMGTLCLGLQDQLAEIGYSVKDSYTFTGWEKFYIFCGRLGIKSMTNTAHAMRIERLQNQQVKQSVDLVSDYVRTTVNELGEVENQYKSDVNDYKETLNLILKKIEQSTPAYKAAKELREKLEEQVKSLRLELEAGMVAEAERPTKEQELEQLERDCQDALLEETDRLEVLNNAQRALLEVKKNRDAAEKSVIAIHQMRRGLLEKMENFRSVMENAMTAVIARAKLERYNVMDPAVNKVVTEVTNHNIAVMGAAMQLAMDRAERAAIDPKESARLTNEFLGHINDYMNRLIGLEEEAEAGVRRPNSNNGPANAGTDLK